MNNALLFILSCLLCFQPTSDDIEQLFPKKFPKRVQTALQQKSVNANHQNIICQHVVAKLYEEGYDSNKCLQKAARRMTKRWSPFKDPLNEVTGLVSYNLF